MRRALVKIGVASWFASLFAGPSAGASSPGVFDFAEEGVAVRIADLEIDPAQLAAY